MQNTIATSASTTQSAATAQPVVQNDASATAEKALKATYALIEQMAVEREVWQENAFRKSNEQLYSLLERCYQYYKSMSEDTAEGKALRKGLNDYIALKGYAFTKATHTITKIVKCVFGVDRRRVSAYSIVLRAALAKGVNVLDIPAFIRDSGGVEEIRLAKSPNAMTAKQKAAAVTDAVSAHNLGVISKELLGAQLDAGKIGEHTVLIGTWQADGSVVLRAVVESDTVLNAALASYYSANKGAAKKQAVEKEAANDADAKQQAIDKAVNA